MTFLIFALIKEGCIGMGLKSRLKVEDGGFLAASVFNVVVGVLCLAILALVDFGLIHVGLIGIISLVTAYGLFRRRFWAVWSMSIATFMATVFAVSTLYYTLGDLPLNMAVIVYVVLTWVFAAYAASRRGKLEL
ncbi:MAG: hypothetical protein QXO67_02435 [Candidatus Bathyarchaeia archaeon]